MAFGVPEITQVVGLIVAHAGSAVVEGFVAQLIMGAPASVRVVGAIDIVVLKRPVVPFAPE